jgi:hypothetical protein
MTFKTDHPIIREIAIGDQFVTRGGLYAVFFKVNLSDIYPFIFKFNKDDYYYETSPYTKKLTYFENLEVNKYDIISKCIKLKDKLSIL